MITLKNIAVLGGGGTGCTIAANLTLAGQNVALYEHFQHWENLREIQKNGGVIHLTGQIFNGDAKIYRITDNMREAVQKAEIVFIAVIAGRHESLCKELAPLLRDGQVICFSAGYCASIILRKHLPKDRDVIIGEMQGNVYSCRMVNSTTAFSATPYTPKKVSAFPAKDTNKLVEALSEIYPCSPCKNVLEAALNSPNVSGHLAGSLLNTCAIESNPDFRLYADGLSEGVLRCIQAVEEEKCAVMEAAGLTCERHLGMVARLMQYDSFPELDDFRSLSGPNSMKHRYIVEDASTGQALLISLGEAVHVPTPYSQALVTLASAINQMDYHAHARTIQELGINNMSVDEINQYLETSAN